MSCPALESQRKFSWIIIDFCPWKKSEIDLRHSVFPDIREGLILRAVTAQDSQD